MKQAGLGTLVQLSKRVFSVFPGKSPTWTRKSRACSIMMLWADGLILLISWLVNPTKRGA